MLEIPYCSQNLLFMPEDRSVFRVIGIYTFGWILGLSSHIVRSFVSRRVYYVCQEAIGKGIIMLYKRSVSNLLQSS